MLAGVRNDLGWSQERAAAESGVAKRTISRYEINPEVATPRKVLKIAEAYQNSEIIEWYCTEVCAIGKEHHCSFKINDFSTSVIAFIKELGDLVKQQESLISIACDGQIDQTELEKLNLVMLEVEHVERAIHALKNHVAHEVAKLKKRKTACATTQAVPVRTLANFNQPHYTTALW